MKVPARRRGNLGKSDNRPSHGVASMKVPARRRGNLRSMRKAVAVPEASMKVPARRRGNQVAVQADGSWSRRLNESPRPKAGKSSLVPRT